MSAVEVRQAESRTCRDTGSVGYGFGDCMYRALDKGNRELYGTAEGVCGAADIRGDDAFLRLETAVEGDYPYQHITREYLASVIEQFVGEVDQVPPVFSAVRVDGVRAYEKARKGKGPEMQSRKVYIKEIEIVRFELPVVELRIVCGKGTYIRSLANDLGKACRSGAYLSALRRTAIGDFRVENANNMEDLVAYLQEKP